MSANIRKQLGPIQKRLHDRINEAQIILEDDDNGRMKDVRIKLAANIESLEKTTDKLNELKDIAEEEQIIINNEFEKSAQLNVEANEIYYTLNQRIDEVDVKGRKAIRIKEDEKLERELEKIKLETEYRRSKLEKLREDKRGETTRKIKLLILSLPSFSGTVTEWPTFWDSFASTIHLNENVSKVDKFKYLMSTLKGEAKDTLAGFNLTEAQYDQAIAFLKERYDDQEFIIHKHYTALSNAQRSSNSTRELRQTLNFLETHIRSLQGMGEDIENNYMVSLIKSKMPEDFNVKLEETRNERWTVEKIRKSINKIITAREKSEQNQSIKSAEEELQYTGEGLLGKDFQVKCAFCEGSHWADECQKYKTVEERKKQARGRCFICLSKKHLFRECVSEKQCFYCKRKNNHHSSLCPSKFGCSEAEFVEICGNTEVDDLEVPDLIPF